MILLVTHPGNTRFPKDAKSIYLSKTQPRLCLHPYVCCKHAVFILFKESSHTREVKIKAVTGRRHKMKQEWGPGPELRPHTTINVIVLDAKKREKNPSHHIETGINIWNQLPVSTGNLQLLGSSFHHYFPRAGNIEIDLRWKLCFDIFKIKMS